MPLLSKVCPVCGYVVNDGEETPTAEEMADTLEELLLQIKNLPKPSFLNSMRNLLYALIPLATLYFIVLALISEAGIFWLIGGLGALISVYLIVHKVIEWCRPRSCALTTLKNEYEYHARTARRSFGKNVEVSRLINEITAEIAAVDEEHRAAKRRNIYMWVIFCAAVLVIGTGGIVTTSVFSKDGTSEEQTEGQPAWQKKIAEFAASADNSDYGDNSARLAVLDEILKCGEYKAAEEFFFTYSQGKMGDLECAKQIVQAYLSAGDAAAAADFVGRVELRYASDVAKLKKMLE